jgi:CCR4-NOT transcription complex subunit 4
VQKNLVYVTGLSPRVQEDKLLETLRGDQYFGQYGKIVKIVVSKAKDNINPQSVGVYVTYARKQDAASCIAAVDSSQNGDRVLRAQFGTTKYCSAYLRNSLSPPPTPSPVKTRNTSPQAQVSNTTALRCLRLPAGHPELLK